MVWHALLQLLRSVWHKLCGGVRRVSRHNHHLDRASAAAAAATADRAERQQLLDPEAGLGSSSSPAGSPEPLHRPLQVVVAASAAAPATSAAPRAPPQLPCTIIVMRHGHRQDEEDSMWTKSAARPWDPPLSATGKTQAAAAAGKLPGPEAVDYVISSPFKRCLQTSAGVVRALPGLKEGHWLVDWQLAEVCEPRVLFGMNADARRLATDSNVEAWMWSGVPTDAALDKFAREDCRLQQLPFKPLQRGSNTNSSNTNSSSSANSNTNGNTASSSNRPVYPEELEDGLGRYSAAMKEIARTFAGHTVLLVTHGECVRQAVLMAEPSSEVFEVHHTGYVVLQHTPHHQQQQHSGSGSSSRRSWQLTSGSGETGVLWIEDDDDDDDD